MPNAQRPPTVSGIGIARASESQRARGLIAWVCLVLDGSFRLDGLVVRRTLKGEFRVSFPKHRDGNNVTRSPFRPLTREAQESIERPVLDAVRRRGWLS